MPYTAYVLANKLLFTDLYSVLYLLIRFVDSSNSTKVLFAFPDVFHISLPLIVDTICFHTYVYTTTNGLNVCKYCVLHLYGLSM